MQISVNGKYLIAIIRIFKTNNFIAICLYHKSEIFQLCSCVSATILKMFKISRQGSF